MLAYHDQYGYSYRDALAAEFWWRVEHLFDRCYRGENGGVFGAVHRFGYAKRKQAERRGAA